MNSLWPVSYTHLDVYKRQVSGNKEKIENIHHIQLNMQEEMDRINIRPTCSTQHTMLENRESVNFREYRRNPIGFLERIDEGLSQKKENRWSIIKTWLGNSFKGITDNWWSAIRNELNNYEEFKQVFRSKYWSRSSFVSSAERWRTSNSVLQQDAF